MNKNHVAGYILTGVASLAVGAVVGTATSTEALPKPGPTVTKTIAAPTPSASESSAPAPKGDWSPQEWARQFKAFTVKHGTAQQKAVVNHVTKLKGFDGNADDWEAWEVKVYTDYQGEEYDHDSEAELIVDALTDWQESEKGDVSIYVYNANGDDEGSGNL
ncbi:hypothetical protein [Streptomyces sp. NBC_00154]|uniref:hypothetical protein n=1 Tax=Streptomyces sp. NBC_00154 TaxID=2975670 RepID=UPI002256DA2F|nr:hypothetical protein [Streptomyces sp. NBC_00154]MCX5314741.1 hypothetical protein [Streptomyces sp. NBC_00154]